MSNLIYTPSGSHHADHVVPDGERGALLQPSKFLDELQVRDGSVLAQDIGIE